MIRKKWAVLGLSALALLATSAFVANGAQGNNPEPEFTCLENHETQVGCTGHGKNIALDREHAGGFSPVHTFSAGFATLRCTETTFDVTTDADGKNPTPIAAPTYTNCFADPGNLQVHVETNECEFQFHPKHTSGETVSTDEYTGTASIVNCKKDSGGITVRITNNEKTIPTNENGNTKCLVHIPEQKDIGPIYFRTDTHANLTDVEVEAKTAKAKAIFTGGFFNCGAGENADTFYTGNTTVQAKNHNNELVDLELH